MTLARQIIPVLMLALTALLAGGGSARAAEAPDWLLGRWVLNNELTVAVQDEKKKGTFDGFGGVSTSVAVGGVAVPLPGSGATPPPTGNPQDPKVLRCAELEISMQDENLLLHFVGVGKELLKPGNNQGRVSRWNRSKLTSNYETTSRKVRRTYQLQKDGTLLVTVKIKPRQAASIVQRRVFERASELPPT